MSPLPPLEHIRIYPDHSAGAWLCDHAPDPSAPFIRSLFGTTILPLPFADSCDVAIVVADINARHPGVVIDIRK